MIREAIERDRNKLAKGGIQEVIKPDDELKQEIIKCFPEAPQAKFWNQYLTKIREQKAEDIVEEESDNRSSAPGGDKAKRRLTLAGPQSLLIEEVLGKQIQQEERTQVISEAEVNVDTKKIKSDPRVKVLFKATSPISRPKPSSRMIESAQMLRGNRERNKKRIELVKDCYSKIKNLSWEEMQWRRENVQEIKRLLFQNNESEQEWKEEERSLENTKKEKKLEFIVQEENRTKSDGPKVQAQQFPFGTCLEHLYNHSWSNPTKRWVWVPKGCALVAAELGLGHPAKREEVERFGR